MLSFYVACPDGCGPRPRPKLRAQPFRIKGSSKWGATVYLRLEEYHQVDGNRVRLAWDAKRWWDRIIERCRVEARVLTEPIKGPIRMDTDFFFPRTGDLLRASAPAGRIPHDKKPDRDNLEKLLCDAITQCGWYTIGEEVQKRPLIWYDDGQVHSGEPVKWYCAKGDRPGARIVISRLTTPEPALFGKATEVAV